MRETDTHIYFWRGWLSNFQKCNILYENMDFHCSEQLYMAFKAWYFRDKKNYRAILNCETARQAKNLGSIVENFDQNVWNGVSFHFMNIACSAKFQQNKDLKSKLIATGNKILVEASPMDLIWGVGFEETDDLILDENNWKGENRLGKVLMEVRNNL